MIPDNILVEIPAFKWSTWFVFSKDGFDTLEEEGYYDFEDDLKEGLESCDGMTYKLMSEGCYSYIVYIDIEDAICPLATLAHECSHVADHLCTDRGIPINMDNTEVRAYILAYLFKVIKEHIE